MEVTVGDVAAVAEVPPTVLELFETGVRHVPGSKPVFLDGNDGDDGATIFSKANRFEDDTNGGGCRIEYQITESVEGRCERLGRGDARACVSDEHMVPFHPECLM